MKTQANPYLILWSIAIHAPIPPVWCCPGSLPRSMSRWPVVAWAHPHRSHRSHRGHRSRPGTRRSPGGGRSQAPNATWRSMAQHGEARGAMGPWGHAFPTWILGWKTYWHRDITWPHPWAPGALQHSIARNEPGAFAGHQNDRTVGGGRTWVQHLVSYIMAFFLLHVLQFQEYVSKHACCASLLQDI